MGIRQRKATRGKRSLGAAQKQKLKKKALQRRKGRVSLKQVFDPALKERWVASKSVGENAARLGLVLRVNDDIGKRRKQVEGEVPVEKHELIDIFEEKAARGEAPRPNYLAEGDKFNLKRLVDKYGEDYTKMARDMRLNSYQHTARKLQKKCEKYKAEIASVKSKRV